MAIDLDKIETKLAAARTRLILDKPFLGALVLRLPMHVADPKWCPTTATDARAFYYNPEFIGALDMAETQFMLAHEALHCALSHFARRQHRVKHRWDLACDYAVNPLLIDDGLKAPPSALYMPAYEGMTAEEIYPLLDDNDESETLDRHAYDSDSESGEGDSGLREHDIGNSDSNQSNDTEDDSKAGGQAGASESGDGGAQPPPLRADERATLSVQWQQRIAGAAQQAMQAGKLGGQLKRMIDHLLQPQLPWRMLLARYMSTVAHDDYTYKRPSRREGDFILPSLRSSQLDVVVAIDTSGSIKPQEMQEFADEIDALKAQVGSRVTLLACDAELAANAPWVYEPWERFECPESVHGGGGTRFVPVFEWVELQRMRPDLLIYFTDADGEFPSGEPSYPVIWLVKGRSQVPWGQRIQLN